jgi:hypothetical protein
VPERDTTSVPPAFHSSLPLTLAERDLIGWYFPFPIAHRLALAPRTRAEASDAPPSLYIGSDGPEVSQ